MKSKLRIAFVTIVPSPYQRDLFSALAKQESIDLEVYYMEAGSPDSPWPEKSLRPFERIVPGFWVPLGDARVHVNWSFPSFVRSDIVVVSTITSLTGQYLMRVKLRDKRWIFWGERLHRNSGIKDFIQRGLAAPMAHAAGIVGVGRAAEDEYRRRFPKVPIFSIPYHCTLTDFFEIKRARKIQGPLTFLFCGQMIQRKGVDLLLLAFDQLILKGLEANLLLVGRQAELPEFLTRVSSKARAKIVYEGFQPPERLPEYFARSDVFVLPSRYDGWGVVINQALASALPVVTTNEVGAGVDLVEHGINGLRIGAGDLGALRQAMETFVLAPEIAFQWGKVSRNKARDLTPELGALKWIRVFERIQACPA